MLAELKKKQKKQKTTDSPTKMTGSNLREQMNQLANR